MERDENMVLMECDVQKVVLKSSDTHLLRYLSHPYIDILHVPDEHKKCHQVIL